MSAARLDPMARAARYKRQRGVNRITRMQWKRLRHKAKGAVVLVAPRATRTDCPHCGRPVPGLLAGCPKPACLARSLTEEMAHVRREDR